MKLAAFSSLALVLFLTGAGHADELSYVAVAPAAHGSDTSVLRVPAFDTRLGTLVRVDITVETVFDALVRVENTGPQFTFAQLALDSSLSLFVPGESAPYVVTDSRWASCALPASDGSADFVGPSSMQFQAQFTLGSKLALASNLEKFETHGVPRRIALRTLAESAVSVACSQPTIADDEFTLTRRLRITYVFDRA